MADQGPSADHLWHSDAKLELLGPVRLGNSAGDDLTPKARKTRALVALVALAKGPIPRARLVNLLWGDRGEEQGKASLRQALYELRSLAGSSILSAGRETVGFGTKPLTSDLEAVGRHILDRDAAALAAAMDAIALPLLGGLDDITPELDEWLRDERARLAASLARGTLEVGQAALGAGGVDQARRLADQLERLDPLDECAARLGIEADLAAGDRAAAARRHGRLERRFRDELGIAPSGETASLLKRSPSAMPAPPANPATLARLPRAWLLIGLALALLIAALGAFLWLRPPTAAANPTVAVLPFDDLGSTKNSYFASGVSDEILNLLANQKRLKILGRVSAAQLADPARSLTTARQLGVGYLLDGSVRLNGAQVLVIARLTRVADGEQIWSERYERSEGDIFAVQREIAGAVAVRMARSLGDARPQETSPKVYDRYLAARQLLRERRELPLAEADRLLTEAIARDANYAPAFAELAQVKMLRADTPTSYGTIPIEQARAQAERLARRAIELDPNLGDGYAALGFLSLTLDARSEPYFRKAIALDPQRAEFHRWHAQTLMAQNRFDEAIAEFKRAVEIDPLWGLSYDHLTGALYLVGRKDEARAYVRHFLALSTDQRSKMLVIRAMANLDDRRADEFRILRALYRAYPQERQMQFNYATMLALLGEQREAVQVIAYDPLAVAALSRNWPSLAARTKAMGSEFWEQWNYWGISSSLLASGHGAVIVDHYDRDRALIDSRRIDPLKVITPELSLALRQVGRGAEADRVLERFAAERRRLPDNGLLGVQKRTALATVAAIRGQRDAALGAFEQQSRDFPWILAHVPAHSLIHDVTLANLVGDPRLAALDERLHATLNSERAKVGLPLISQTTWISAP